MVLGRRGVIQSAGMFCLFLGGRTWWLGGDCLDPLAEWGRGWDVAKALSAVVGAWTVQIFLALHALSSSPASTPHPGCSACPLLSLVTLSLFPLLTFVVSFDSRVLVGSHIVGSDLLSTRIRGHSFSLGC